MDSETRRRPFPQQCAIPAGLICLLLTVLFACTPRAAREPTLAPSTPTPAQTARPSSLPTSAPTASTPAATRTPTITPAPTETPVPTHTPTPTSTPIPLPDIFRPVVPIAQVLPGDIERLQPAPDGGLWLVTDQGVAKLLDGTWTVQLSGFTGELAGIDAAGRAWVVSEDAGTISAWDGASWMDYGAEAGWLPIALEDEWYRDAGWGQSDGLGRFWLATSQDVRAFDGARWTVFTPAEMGMGEVGPEELWPSFVVEISQSTDTVWVGECDLCGPGPSGGQGARWFDGSTWYGADSPVASGCTTAIEEDNLGRVWLNTDEILWRYEPASGNWTQFAPPEPPVDLMYFRFADTITLDPSGDAWPAMVLCGGSCYGKVVLYHVHEGTWTQIGAESEFDDPPYSLVFAAGASWLFWDRALYRLAGDVPERLADLAVQSVAVDVAGRLWFVAQQEGRSVLWTLATIEEIEE